jgi:hypothetical protein
MKQVITLLCILFSLCAHAQFNKGDKFIGGSIILLDRMDGENNSSKNNEKSFGVSPAGGVFLNKNFAVGANVGYSYDAYEYFNGLNYNDQTYHMFTSEIFAKRFFTISDKFFFALKGGTSYTRNKRLYSNSGSETTTTSYTLGANVTPSFIFFPSSHWGIEAGLGNLSYAHLQQLSGSGKTDIFNFNAGSFSLGFSYYLRK